MTAAAFAKGLLALEGELTPILVQMVKSANTDGLLNDDYNARQFQDDIKKYLHSTLQVYKYGIYLDWVKKLTKYLNISQFQLKLINHPSRILLIYSINLRKTVSSTPTTIRH
jgi:hypothetical protein